MTLSLVIRRGIFTGVHCIPNELLTPKTAVEIGKPQVASSLHVND